MPAKKGGDPQDLANRARALRQRVFADERALAVAYPDQVEKLESDLERERAMLAEVEQEVADAKVEVLSLLHETHDRAFEARKLWLSLNGYLNDPGIRGLADWEVEAGQVKAALLRVAEIEPAPHPDVSDVQRGHDERLRNARAGKGYFTDDDLRRQHENPLEFWGGAGARRIRRLGMPAEERS